MLNLIYGLENSDKDDFAHNRIKAVADADKLAWILVPEQFSLHTEKAIIEKFGISAQKNIKVITFSRLCNLVLSKMGPLRMKYIDGAGKQILAARTLRALKGKAGALRHSLSRRGFASTVVDLISEFKRYGVSSDMLKTASEQSDNKELKEKLSDIALIAETFEGFLENHASDAEDNLALIVPRLKECDFLRGELFIMHFRSFTPVEYSAIGELMQIMDICVVCTCDNINAKKGLFAPIALFCQNLMALAKEREIPVAEPLYRDVVSQNAELDHLSRNFFLPRPKPYEDKPKNLCITEASNHYREVEAAADLILRLCRKEGRTFSDFLVLARNTDQYSRIMPAIFKSRGIDVFLDTKRSILTKPLCVMLCSAIEILSYGYSYDRVMNMVRSGLFDITDFDADMFENYILCVNPSHAMWAKEEWTYCPKDYDIDIINRVRSQIKDFIDALVISGRKTAGQICRQILNCLEEKKLAEKTMFICDSYEEKGMPYLAEEEKGVWNSIISVLSQICALMDDENITWQDFGELFKSALGGISVGMTPQTQGSVIFSQIDRFRSSNVPIVIVLGVTEGVFPLAHSAEGILSDAERAELLKLGISLAPSADAKRHEEQLLIYYVLTSAKERLYLFSPLYSSDGAPIEPSPIIKTIKNKLFPRISVYNPDLFGDILRGAEGREASFEVLCSLLAKNGGSVDGLTDAGRELYTFFKESADFASRLEKTVDAMKQKAPEKLSRKAVEAIYGKHIMLSASRLEKYNACAFSYFISYGLLAKEREKAGIEPRSTGSIQHFALCKYFSELKKNNIDYSSVTKEKCYEDIYEIVKLEAIGNTQLLYEASSYYKYVVTRMQGITARTAWEVVKFYRSSLFRPMGFEIEIKTNGQIPVIDIKDENGISIASLRGIIDRADSAQVNGKTYISVVDYKSSKKTLDERLAEAGVNIQPLLYSDAVCSRMNASPAAMLYMQMTDPIVSASKLKSVNEAEIEKAANGEISLGGWLNNDAGVISSYSSGGENGEKFTPGGRAALISEGELKRRIAAANKKIRDAAIGIYHGNVNAEPYADKNYDACKYCIFGGLCDQRRD